MHAVSGLTPEFRHKDRREKDLHYNQLQNCEPRMTITGREERDPVALTDDVDEFDSDLDDSIRRDDDDENDNVIDDTSDDDSYDFSSNTGQY